MEFFHPTSTFVHHVLFLGDFLLRTAELRGTQGRSPPPPEITRLDLEIGGYHGKSKENGRKSG